MNKVVMLLITSIVLLSCISSKQKSVVHLHTLKSFVDQVKTDWPEISETHQYPYIIFDQKALKKKHVRDSLRHEGSLLLTNKMRALLEDLFAEHEVMEVHLFSTQLIKFVFAKNSTIFKTTTGGIVFSEKELSINEGYTPIEQDWYAFEQSRSY